MIAERAPGDHPVVTADHVDSTARVAAAALAYFDSYRLGRGTSNLIQAQRDFFGAHGFERIDTGGAHHGPWGSGAAG